MVLAQQFQIAPHSHLRYPKRCCQFFYRYFLMFFQKVQFLDHPLFLAAFCFQRQNLLTGRFLSLLCTFLLFNTTYKRTIHNNSPFSTKKTCFFYQKRPVFGVFIPRPCVSSDGDKIFFMKRSCCKSVARGDIFLFPLQFCRFFILPAKFPVYNGSSTMRCRCE